MLLVIECMITCIIFAVIVLSTQYKDPVKYIMSYPPEIRKRVESLPEYKNSIKYKFPNLPYYRGAADQVFFLGRPLGRFGLSSAGFFLGLPRFLGAGLGIGFERPRASSSSNT